MTLTEMRTAMASALAVCGAERVHDKEPDTISELPCLIVGNPIGSYDDDFDGDLTYVFPVLLIVSRANDSKQAIAEIDPYITPTGAHSVRVALAAVRQARVVGFSQFAAEYTFGETDYAGITFEVQVLSD